MHFYARRRRWLPRPFLHRDFLSTHVWKRLDKRRIIYTLYDADDTSYPPKNSIGCEFKKGGSCRSKCFGSLLIESTVPEGEKRDEIFHNSKVVWMVDLDPAGTMPSHLRSVASHRALGVLEDMYHFFNEVRVCELRSDEQRRRA